MKGLTRRLRRGKRACSPYGTLDCFGRRSEGDWGERREAGIQWIQPPKAVSDPEFRQTTSGTHGSANRADCLPRGKPPVPPQAHSPAPWWGLTRRLRRGSRASSPMGRSHFSFGGERKVCKRKPAARRLREKALYCPFLKEGVRNVARRIVGEITPALVRARAHSFPLSKRARLFPSAAYRRSSPRSWRRAYSNFAGWKIAVFPVYLCNAKC